MYTARFIKFHAIPIALLLLFLPIACSQVSPAKDDQYAEHETEGMSEKVIKTDEEWLQILTLEQYEVTRRRGTEPPFSGKYYDFTEQGVYKCVCCGNELFSSETKFDSGSGWPSFWSPISEQSLETATDLSHGMVRIEVMCRTCGAHLGHVFKDGPPPSGLRYCINSVALNFVDDRKK